MKNLFLAASLVLALGANAAITTTSINTVITVKQEKEYAKIEASKVSAQVLKEIETKYAGYSIAEAAQAADGEYKLTLTKDTTKLTVHYKSNGEFVKEQK
jgi:hypothetical protein